MFQAALNDRLLEPAARAAHARRLMSDCARSTTQRFFRPLGPLRTLRHVVYTADTPGAEVRFVVDGVNNNVVVRPADAASFEQMVRKDPPRHVVERDRVVHSVGGVALELCCRLDELLDRAGDARRSQRGRTAGQR